MYDPPPLPPQIDAGTAVAENYYACGCANTTVRWIFEGWVKGRQE